MRFHKDSESEANTVRGYAEGVIYVGDRTITQNVVLTAKRIVTNWPPRSVGELTKDHLDVVLALDPDLIIIGSGKTTRFPDQAILAKVLQAGIGLEVMDTAAACRTYNILVHEERKVAAALIIE